MNLVVQVLFASFALVFSSEIVVVRQDSTAKGYVESLGSSNGELVTSSDVSFVFDWPLVQMTSDNVNHEVYVITYPEGYPGAVLYNLNADLSLIQQYDDTDFSYFDLQYSAEQSTLYGILVTSSYGRVLSNFSLANDEVTATQLFTLPYMWYVNASSFHTSTCTYFALINNFPGFPNSTLDQQLIVADFSVENKPDAEVLPISSNGMLVQFIAYSAEKDILYCSGMTNTSATVAIMGLDGRTRDIVFSMTAVAMGPLVANDDNSELLTFIKTSSEPAKWELWSIPYDVANGVVSKRVNSFEGDNYDTFAAGSLLKL